MASGPTASATDSAWLASPYRGRGEGCMTGVVAEDSNRALDDHVEREIAACLDLNKPKSFFLFAGAGSGKTRSLINALKHLRKHYGTKLRFGGQRIAVITYTNAACDEIVQRLEFDPLIQVS